MVQIVKTTAIVNNEVALLAWRTDPDPIPDCLGVHIVRQILKDDSDDIVEERPLAATLLEVAAPRMRLILSDAGKRDGKDEATGKPAHTYDTRKADARAANVSWQHKADRCISPYFAG
ncbi:hypothetical protein ACWGS9_32000 [Bradyrhizobium sp. Arg314]